MKFYLVWDRNHKRYVGAYKYPYPYDKNPSDTPRIYYSHRNAAAAASGWVRLKDHTLTGEELKTERQKQFEIHEFEVDEYKVVG